MLDKIEDADEDCGGEEEEESGSLEVVEPVVKEQVAVGQATGAMRQEESMESEDGKRDIIVEKLDTAIDEVGGHGGGRRVRYVRSHGEKHEAKKHHHPRHSQELVLQFEAREVINFVLHDHTTSCKRWRIIRRVLDVHSVRDPWRYKNSKKTKNRQGLGDIRQVAETRAGERELYR